MEVVEGDGADQVQALDDAGQPRIDQGEVVVDQPTRERMQRFRHRRHSTVWVGRRSMGTSTEHGHLSPSAVGVREVIHISRSPVARLNGRC